MTSDSPDHELDPAAADAVSSAGEEMTYERAVERLEAIIARLDSGQAELRETLALVREGKGLVEFSKAELDAVSGELRELDLEALVEQLDAASGE